MRLEVRIAKRIKFGPSAIRTGLGVYVQYFKTQETYGCNARRYLGLCLLLDGMPEPYLTSSQVPTPSQSRNVGPEIDSRKGGSCGPPAKNRNLYSVTCTDLPTAAFAYSNPGAQPWVRV